MPRQEHNSPPNADQHSTAPVGSSSCSSSPSLQSSYPRPPVSSAGVGTTRPAQSASVGRPSSAEDKPMSHLMRLWHRVYQKHSTESYRDAHDAQRARRTNGITADLATAADRSSKLYGDLVSSRSGPIERTNSPKEPTLGGEPEEEWGEEKETAARKWRRSAAAGDGRKVSPADVVHAASSLAVSGTRQEIAGRLSRGSPRKGERDGQDDARGARELSAVPSHPSSPIKFSDITDSFTSTPHRPGWDGMSNGREVSPILSPSAPGSPSARSLFDPPSFGLDDSIGSDDPTGAPEQGTLFFPVDLSPRALLKHAQRRAGLPVSSVDIQFR